MLECVTMPKCKICKFPFEYKYNSLEKTCRNYDCMVEYALQVAKDPKNKVKAEKMERLEWSNRKAEMTFENMSSDAYRSKIIQPIINEISRLIDYGNPCIASGRYNGKMAGGHFISVGSNRSVALNLHNIHIQTFESNSFRSGDEAKYRLGIIERYGNCYFEFMESLRHLKGIDLSKQRLSELKPLISQIRNDLKRNPIKRTPQERIELRNEINEKIGIYPDIFIN